MYGKIYPSLYSGSMIGAGPVAFALWPYIITNARPDDGSLIDLNPDLISAIIGCTPKEIQEAVDFFCQPDNRSRTPKANGCRLIKKSPLTYFVVNLEQYRFLDDSDDRREYWRKQKEEQRIKRQGHRNESGTLPGHSGKVPDIHGLSNLSPNADADADADKKVLSKGKSDGNSKVQEMKKQISAMMNRKSGQRWAYEDEFRLAEICRRDDFVAEFTELQAFRNKDPRFFPQSVSSLLENWDSTLDRSRQPPKFSDYDQKHMNMIMPKLQDPYGDNDD